ncbi:MAG: preprotein translocase subunit YajC [Bacteroidales bacterium]|jgi:preprotein translocase subunit YajC|nr:preprotein translocase subunit YajC [Bacteroidales bacterium]
MNIQNILLQAAGGSPNPMGNIILLVGIVVVFYFFMIRPQMKRQKEARKFREGLKKGDKIVTIGGIYGKVVDIKDNNIAVVELAENVVVKMDKSALVADASEIQTTAK